MALTLFFFLRGPRVARPVFQNQVLYIKQPGPMAVKSWKDLVISL